PPELFGALIVFTLVNTVINRLKPPGDGDILVPVGTVAVIGTTEVVVPSADQYAIEPWEVELLLSEGEKLLPRLREFRALRAWAGVRPLFEDNPLPPAAAAPGGLPDPDAVAEYDSRLMSRAHSVLDHAGRDGVEGFISVVGGKFTTFRLMAQETLDLAGKKLGASRPCRTADTRIDPPSASFHTLGQRLGAVEHTPNPEIICECELVTRRQIEQALEASGSLVLNDLRRDLRLGMGPCQAGFCAVRAVGIYWQSVNGSSPDSPPGQPVEAVNSALVQFLQERWKGLAPVMWGANLQQMELDQAMLIGLLGISRLPLAHPPEIYPTEKTA
ncbi:MAG: (2Fe-2S)-binding protein, partial [Anaerolineales bacterium]